MVKAEEIAQMNFFQYIWREVCEDVTLIKKNIPTILITGFLIIVVYVAIWLDGVL